MAGTAENRLNEPAKTIRVNLTTADAAMLRRVAIESFMLLITLLSLLNLVVWAALPDSSLGQVAVRLDYMLCLILFLDFLRRLFYAGDKSAYFFRQFGWADLLGSLPVPGFRLFRLFTVVRVLRVWRRSGIEPMRQSVVDSISASALVFVAFALILLLEFGSALVLHAERGVSDSTIESGGEALWWSAVTVATVGYGDYVPITEMGRSVAVLMMVGGVIMISVLTSFTASQFLARRRPQPKDVARDEHFEQQLAEIKQLLVDMQERDADTLRERKT